MNICRVATVPFMFQNHLRVQIFDTIKAGHRVTLVCSDGPEITALREIPGIQIVLIEIPRAISLRKDLLALWQLFRFFRASGFDIVHSTTPKGGLLAMLAAWVARIPLRLHTFTGQTWVELTGLKRVIVKRADWVTAQLSTMNYTDSISQTKFLIDECVVAGGKIKTLGRGSLSGVDFNRFNSERFRQGSSQCRMQLGLKSASKVVTFVGRLTKDKGIVELIAAFARLQELGYDCDLLLVGPFEPDLDPLPLATMELIKANLRIRCVGYSKEPEKYLAISDIFCLPSYREGFPTAILEAAAMGLPTVGSNINGTSDAVIDGKTGILVQPKDVNALVNALGCLLDGDELRCKMGLAAREQCLKEFGAPLVNSMVIAEYLHAVGPADVV